MICFQPTYKGLKRSQSGVVNYGYSSFQPTYKGLKQQDEENLGLVVEEFLAYL